MQAGGTYSAKIKDFMAYFKKTFAGTRTRTMTTRLIEDSTRVALKVETVIEDKPGLFAIPQWNVLFSDCKSPPSSPVEGNVCSHYAYHISLT